MHELLGQLSNIFLKLGATGLGLNAMIESCIPGWLLFPDILLGGMGLANPEKALFYASVCTLGSVMGGSIGYILGAFGGRPVLNSIFKDKHDKIDAVEKMYEKYGSFAVLVSAFTPIPYNVFTIASGILKMNFLKFFLASFFGRGARFFLVSLVLMFFGETVKKYMDIALLGITGLVILLIGFICWKKHKSHKKEELVKEKEVENAYN